MPQGETSSNLDKKSLEDFLVSLACQKEGCVTKSSIIEASVQQQIELADEGGLTLELTSKEFLLLQEWLSVGKPDAPSRAKSFEDIAWLTSLLASHGVGVEKEEDKVEEKTVEEAAALLEWAKSANPAPRQVAFAKKKCGKVSCRMLSRHEMAEKEADKTAAESDEVATAQLMKWAEIEEAKPKALARNGKNQVTARLLRPGEIK